MVTVVCVDSQNVYKGHIVIMQIGYFLLADTSDRFFYEIKLFLLNIMLINFKNSLIGST